MIETDISGYVCPNFNATLFRNCSVKEYDYSPHQFRIPINKVYLRMRSHVAFN